MNDAGIACFLSAARTGSFTTSAQELSSTQQAVSRNIQSLEDELGFTLLDRSGRRLTLTWEGAQFRRWCLECDRQLALTRTAAARRMGRDAQVLRIGWSDWTGCPAELAEHIRTFSQANPGCTVDVRQGDMGEIRSFLEEGMLDLAVLPEYNTHDLSGMVVSEPFMDLPLYAVTHARYPFSQPHPTNTEMTPRKQLASRFGQATEEQVRARVQFFCAPLGIYPEHLELKDNVASTLSELPCGPCYTIAPRTVFNLRRDDLVFHPLELSVPLVFVRPQDSTMAWVPLFEAFVRQRRQYDEP